MAALAPLPVIGVPMQTSSLNGQDSLYSAVSREVLLAAPA
jgi:phosphoribosylcarboxyaminoimidazole (NCAIR) mutase